ncbi:hypothetical protein F4777DRAFT_271696 [Nemania sp. FL0916]|nr:hypothetical protein F4777DRAFT_271696 [Nemania sp. FL0916]
MASRTPPLLEPYLRLPPAGSLTLLTGVLGSSTNWLVHRYLYSLLALESQTSHPYSSYSSPIQRPRQEEPSDADLLQHGQPEQKQKQHISVVLVSFLRDHVFWKDGCRRLGLDLDLAAKNGSAVFVDGLTNLFVPPPQPLSRGPRDTVGRRVLLEATTDHFQQTLEAAVADLQAAHPGTQTVLVLDQPDVLLAAGGDGISAPGLRDAILGLREKVHACIVTVSGDEPLIVAQSTPLELEHASLALSLAHDAHLVISLRMLDTGTAKDVSGILRVTPGGDEEITTTATPVEDRELLYFIRGDGSVRVFERGQ